MRLKNIPRLQLADLLRRRKMTQNQFLSEFGITTYEGLVIRCARMGVLPPGEHEFAAATPAVTSTLVVNNPPEGVVVLEPTTSDELEDNMPSGESDEGLLDVAIQALEQPTKKQKKRKEPTTGD